MSGDYMINTEILAKVYELKEKLINSDEYKKVKNTEKEMEEKCSSILIKYNYLFDEYNNAIRFINYGSDVESVQKQLAACKLELDNNEYVKEYKKAYKDMNVLLKRLENIIFDGIIVKKDIEV